MTTTNILDKTIEEIRKPTYPIDSSFIKRWSTRAFSEKPVPDEILYSVFEAARWAASARNIQPWRFVIARNEEDKEKFHSFIFEANNVWCKKAPVIALVLSKTEEDGRPISHNQFEAGMATANLLFQATQHGLITHFMSGIYPEKAREVLEIPSQYEILGVIAIGYQGDKSDLPEALQAREIPNSRKDLSEILFEGNFNEK